MALLAACCRNSDFPYSYVENIVEKHVPVNQIVHVPVERPVDVERLVIKEKAVEIEKVLLFLLTFNQSIVTFIAGCYEAGSSRFSCGAGLKRNKLARLSDY